MRQRRRGCRGLTVLINHAWAQARATGWGLLLAGAVGATPAATLKGKVVGVTDGDTVVVLDDQHQNHRVRLAGIDAPEKHQAHAERAHQQLAGWVHGRQVLVHHDHKDRYGRVVGQVWVNGQDINLAMVQHGWAWHYRAYAQEQSPEDRVRYAHAEQHARLARSGLWAGPAPTAPWLFRSAKSAVRTPPQGAPEPR